MKTLCLLLLLGLSFFSDAQINVGSVEHPFRFQVYTGGPSILKAAFHFSSSFQDKVTYSGRSLIGFSADYRLLERLSVGADVAYRYGELNMDISDSSSYVYLRDKWGIDQSDVPNPYGHYRLEIPRLRIMLSATFHALPSHLPSDVYAQFGLGYNRVNAQLFLNDKKIDYFNRIGTFSLPLAYRLSVGYAYHFGNVVGLFTEVGIGGPVFSVGVSAKF